MFCGITDRLLVQNIWKLDGKCSNSVHIWIPIQLWKWNIRYIFEYKAFADVFVYNKNYL